MSYYLRAFRLAILISAILLSPAISDAEPVKHVIVISVDGMGAGLLQKARAHHLKRLKESGSAAKTARTIDPPLTVPGHVSMLTGVAPSRHGLLHNHMSPELDRVGLPTIFDLVSENGLAASAVFGKEKLSHVFQSGSDVRISQPSWPLVGDAAGRFPSLIEAAAVREMKEKKPALLFVHYALPDTIGHWFRWEGVAQRAAMRMVDTSIARLLKKARVIYKDEPFAVIITADHGGHGGAHGQTLPDGSYEAEHKDFAIPWIVVGAKIRSDVDIVHVYDTAPTVAHLLGLEVPAEWNWQGRSVVE